MVANLTIINHVDYFYFHLIILYKNRYKCIILFTETVNNISSSAQAELERKILTGEALAVEEINETSNEVYLIFKVIIFGKFLIFK